ncbi:glutathione S-transferase family protein [Zavarzinia sp.]|uniref:glutathione S-transferase family protein n=1 Tax=Zavarzinia sp. TaxID=2027920 RepID=UPI003568C222
MTQLRLYDFAYSGHCHRVALFLSLLGLPFETVPVNLAKGEQRKPPFLAVNPAGQVPVLDDGGLLLAESNAILVYLARKYAPGSAWLPNDAEGGAEVERWLSIAAGPLFRGPATARLALSFRAPLDLGTAQTTAERLFALMERHLATRDFLAGPGPTIADVALYSYTAAAPEGGIPLEPYPAIRAWLGRVEALPGFRAMPPLPAAA